jgi:hypothetical protein
MPVGVWLVARDQSIGKSQAIPVPHVQEDFDWNGLLAGSAITRIEERQSQDRKRMRRKQAPIWSYAIHKYVREMAQASCTRCIRIPVRFPPLRKFIHYCHFCEESALVSESLSR